MQAANLFERTVKGIARCVVAAPAAEARLMAQKALLALLESLDAWAGSLKVGCCNIDNDIDIVSSSHCGADASVQQRSASGANSATHVQPTAVQCSGGTVGPGLAAVARLG